MTLDLPTPQGWLALSSLALGCFALGGVVFWKLHGFFYRQKTSQQIQQYVRRAIFQ